MTGLLLFLIFVAPTIQYRVELPLFSFAIMEPIVLLASGILIARALSSRESIRIPRSWPEIGLIALVAWAALIRPWSQDWKHGLSDIRDWAIPVLTFITLRSTVRRGWHNAIAVFVTVVSLTAMVGVYQGLTGRLRPFMSPEASLKVAPGATTPGGARRWNPASELSIWESYARHADLSEEGLVEPDRVRVDAASVVPPPFAVGFFAHPNSMGMFLGAGLMLALGWAADRRRPLGWAVPALVALAFALTYAKTAYLVLAVQLAAILLLRWFRSVKAVAVLALGATAAGGALLAGLPPTFFHSLAWRYGLWTTAAALLVRSPTILLFGNGIDPFANLAYYPQPHNNFIYVLLEYGLPGLCLLVGVIGSTATKGWRDGRDGYWGHGWSLQALWIAALGFYAIGLAESMLYGIEARMVVLSFLACYLGLREEVRSSGGPTAGPSPTTPDG